MIRWNFPSNDNGQINGINDSGMNYFIGEPLKSLAREICQNSLDAGREKMVKIIFDKFELETYNLPGYKELEFAFKKSKEFWIEQNDNITKNFFEKAIQKINEPKVTMLRISDFNTCGLTGSKKEWNTNWINLIKTSGASDKNGEAGGSFGIGKFAPYACSDFRTVFYSTYDQKKVKASQGVSRLVTFIRQDGEKTQGIGYYGNDERNTPMDKMLTFKEKFRRESYGTDIFIAGFSFNDELWESEMIVSIIDGFIGAIWFAKLEVSVNGNLINKETLPEIIEKYKETISKYAIDYYTVLTSFETKWFESDCMNLGKIKLGLIIKTDLNRRVAMIRRTGMKIMDQGGINNNIPFAGVMLIEGNNINIVLRKLENPRHTKWETNRALNPAHAKNVIKYLKKFIRESLESMIKNQPDEILEAEGLGEFLPDEIKKENENSVDPIEDLLTETKDIDIEIKEVNPIAANKLSKEEKAESIDGEIEKDGVEGNIDYSDGKNEIKKVVEDKEKFSGDEYLGKYPKMKLTKIEPRMVKSIIMSKEEGLYSILVKTDISYQNCQLKMFLAGEIGLDGVKILEAYKSNNEQLKHEGNTIYELNFMEDEMEIIMVKIDFYELCGMEVEIYENKV